MIFTNESFPFQNENKIFLGTVTCDKLNLAHITGSLAALLPALPHGLLYRHLQITSERVSRDQPKFCMVSIFNKVCVEYTSPRNYLLKYQLL